MVTLDSFGQATLDRLLIEAVSMWRFPRLARVDRSGAPVCLVHEHVIYFGTSLVAEPLVVVDAWAGARGGVTVVGHGR